MNRYRADEVHVTVTRSGSRLLVRWQSADHDVFGDILAGFRSALPRHGEVCWSAEHSAWSVSPHARGRLEQWLAWTFEPACIDWLDEESATHGTGRTYSKGRAYGYGRYREPESVTTTVEAAYARLYLVSGAPLWAAEAMYKAAIKRHHPDAGGDHGTAVALTEAITTIREHAERKAS